MGFFEIFLKVFGFYADTWCDLWEVWLNEPVDYLEGMVLSFIMLPLLACVIDGLYHAVWVNRYHREDLCCIFLLLLQIPVAVFFALSIIIKDRQPLVSGVRRKLRKFRRAGVLLIERLVWQDAPSDVPTPFGA